MVEARLGETVLTAEQTAAEVGRPNLEFDRLDLDDAMLTRIATATGGPLLPHQHGRPADRRARPQGKAAARLAGAAALLPRRFWVLFVGVLATEWVLRRRFQLR